MARFTTSSSMVVGLVCCALFASVAVAGPVESNPAATEMLKLGLRGVYFVPNQGQWSDSEVHYGLRSRGLDVAFRESALTMHMTREVESTSRADASTSRAREEAGFSGLSHDIRSPLADTRGSSGEPATYEHLTLTVTFPGSNAVLPVGGNPQRAKFNYFVGGEGRTTASNVPSFGSVVYENLYDGVDLHVMGNDDGILKYEFHVAPGADYSQVRIAYDGIDSLCIDDAGNLQINTSFGTLADAAPIVWQEDSTSRAVASTSRACEEAGFSHASTSLAREEAVFDVERDAPLADTRGSSGSDTIPARFELCDARTYRIALDGPVDPERELIIDPDVQWMYFLGGSDGDFGYGIAVDTQGHALLTGSTYSADFEGRNNTSFGNVDAFVAKASPSGQLQWMTYLGGSRDDAGSGIALDGTGNAVVVGNTFSSDFEGRNNTLHGFNDAFVAKVSSSGTVQWVTYLGGNDNDFGNGVAIDGAGNAFVSGKTDSSDFEGRNNAIHNWADAYVAKVSSLGLLQWMTYLGGSNADFGYGIGVDGSGNAFVAGQSNSADFEGRNNSIHDNNDAFVAKVSASGSLRWMTYLGSSGDDYGWAVAVDAAGNLFVTGQTNQPDFEGRNNAHHGYIDAFALKVSSSGLLQWMTYLGGSSNDYGWGIALVGADLLCVTGYALSTDFEGMNNAYHGGDCDAFVVKASSSGALQWMTYLGGGDAEWGYGIALDGTGSALVTGDTGSGDFEGRNNSKHGGFDAFVMKMRIVDGPELSVNASCPNGGPIAVSWTGATPNGRVALIFARNTGDFLVPANYPCQGTQLGLGTNQIQLVGDYGAGATGERTINGNAGNGACGGYLQLLDLPTCGTSNVARLE